MCDRQQMHCGANFTAFKQILVQCRDTCGSPVAGFTWVKSLKFKICSISGEISGSKSSVRINTTQIKCFWTDFWCLSALKWDEYWLWRTFDQFISTSLWNKVQYNSTYMFNPFKQCFIPLILIVPTKLYHILSRRWRLCHL